MAKSKPPAAPTAYQLMGMRIQKIINAPAAQKAKSVLIQKGPTESQEEWMRFLEEIDENDNVTLSYRDDGSVSLSWVAHQED